MGMQCHFLVSDIPDYLKVHKHSDKLEDSSVDTEEYPPEYYYDYYVVIDPDSIIVSTDSKHENAWFDIGQMSMSAIKTMKFLIQNRICFNCS